ncbi:hypothetical protein SAMN05878503_11955 [Cereibacter ovatus]|uniref:Uncharacterized protein n=1 Tax=Cereibacter ovatus TaxID=439529 RepID=A0A285D4B7_9RHOB|nr:hypothetical protein SAMN05878503_11955 [Cereibacter ovatus]
MNVACAPTRTPLESRLPYATPTVRVSEILAGSESASNGNYPSPNEPCDCGQPQPPGNYPSPNSPCDCK